MASERLAKIKRSICRLDWQEFQEVEDWLRKRKSKMWHAERLRIKKEHEESIKVLPEGTKVVCTDSNPLFCGKIGKVVRHLKKNSCRTAVDFGKEMGVYHVPRYHLSTDISEDRINLMKKGQQVCRNLSGVLSKVLSNMEAKK